MQKIKTKENILLICLAILLTACSSNIDTIATISSQPVQIPTYATTPTEAPTPVPAETPVPTSVPITASKGLITRELNKGEYVELKIVTDFPATYSQPSNTLLKKTLQEMFNSSEWTENGFEITTRSKDIVTLGKSKFFEDKVSFTFSKNGVVYATVIMPRGTVIALNTYIPLSSSENAPELTLNWGMYDPTSQKFVSCFEIPERKSCYDPATFYISIDKDWIPKSHASPYDFSLCSPNSLLADYIKKNGTVSMTRKIPNGEIYIWGPFPLPCPEEIIITYP